MSAKEPYRQHIGIPVRTIKYAIRHSIRMRQACGMRKVLLGAAPQGMARALLCCHAITVQLVRSSMYMVKKAYRHIGRQIVITVT